MVLLNRGEKGRPLLRCPFPNCGRTFVKLAGEPEACPEHRRFIADVIFLLPKITITPPHLRYRQPGPARLL
jgi:hypothetical protein